MKKSCGRVFPSNSGSRPMPRLNQSFCQMSRNKQPNADLRLILLYGDLLLLSRQPPHYFFGCAFRQEGFYKCHPLICLGSSGDPADLYICIHSTVFACFLYVHSDRPELCSVPTLIVCTWALQLKKIILEALNTVTIIPTPTFVHLRQNKKEDSKILSPASTSTETEAPQ